MWAVDNFIRMINFPIYSIFLLLQLISIDRMAQATEIYFHRFLGLELQIEVVSKVGLCWSYFFGLQIDDQHLSLYSKDFPSIYLYTNIHFL